MIRAAIGIDPGKDGAIGLVIFNHPERRILEVRKQRAIFDTYHPSEFHSKAEAALDAIIGADKLDVVIGVIEDNFFKENVDTLKKLVTNQAMWRLAFYLRFGFDPEIASPGTWRSPYGIKKSNGSNLKKQAQALVFERFGLKTTQDEAEAVVMALYGVRTF